jgi:hypothetical protein
MLRGEWAIHPEWVSANLSLGVKKIENESVFAIESIDRQVKIFTDFNSDT